MNANSQPFYNIKKKKFLAETFFFFLFFFFTADCEKCEKVEICQKEENWHCVISVESIVVMQYVCNICVSFFSKFV